MLLACAAVFAETPEVPSASSQQQPPPASPPPGDTFTHAWIPGALPYRPWSVQASGGYNLVTGSAANFIHGRASAAFGITWSPSPNLPLALRLDGSYNWFTPGRELLQSGGVGYNAGERDVYGADLDLQLDVAHPSWRQKVYLLAGVGEYWIKTNLQELSNAPVICGTRFCGRSPIVLATESDTSAGDASWNVGVGWTLALDQHTWVFIEGRYEHLFTGGSDTQFIPLRVGLRF